VTEKKLNALVFVQEEYKDCTNIDDALTNLTPFLKQRTQIDPEKLSFEFNGNAEFIIDGTKRKTTRYGLQSLCRMLKIPDPFATIIPLDLLRQNINRLSELQEDIDVVYDTRGNVTGFVPTKYRPIETIDLLLGLKEIFKEQPTNNLKVRLGTTNTLVGYTSEVFPQLEPVQGDVTQVGIEITNSEVQDLDAAAALLLYRLICENGAVMGTQWGKVTYSKDSKLTYESVFSRFIHRVRDFRTDANALASIYQELPNISLNSKEFTIIYNALTRSFGYSNALELVDMEKDEVKEILQFEKERTSWRAVGSLDKFGMRPRDVELNAYDTFNKITEFGRNLKNTRESRKAKEIGGRMVTMLYEERIQA